MINADLVVKINNSALIILPFYLLVANFGKVNLKDVSIGDKLGQDVLATAESNAIVILQDDTITFNTQYAYYGLRTRPDVIIIVPWQMRHNYYRDYLNSAYPNLDVPEELNLDDLKDK